MIRLTDTPPISVCLKTYPVRKNAVLKNVRKLMLKTGNQRPNLFVNTDIIKQAAITPTRLTFLQYLNFLIEGNIFISIKERIEERSNSRRNQYPPNNGGGDCIADIIAQNESLNSRRFIGAIPCPK